MASNAQQSIDPAWLRALVVNDVDSVQFVRLERRVTGSVIVDDCRTTNFVDVG